MIPAYSPQARGRSERNFGTWQGRLAAGVAAAPDRDAGSGQSVSAGALHRRVQSPLSGRGRSTGQRLCARRSRDLDLIFSLQFERSGEPRQHGQLSESQLADRSGCAGERRLAGCTVMVHQHLDGTLSLTHGPHRLGRYSAQGEALASENGGATGCGKDAGGKVIKPTFPPRLEIPQTPRDSHFPTAPATAG